MILIILLIFFFILDIFLGSITIRPADVLKALAGKADGNIETLIFKFRLPKAFTAILAGIALSLSGLQMQTIFRNPMAGPYVLGVSSGAGLGVALVILGYTSLFGSIMNDWTGRWLIVIASWVGSGLILLLIMILVCRL